MYQILGAILLITFYFIYYGKAFIQKKKGIATNQIKNQKKGIELKIGMLMGISSLLLAIAEIVSIIFDVSLFAKEVRIVGIVLAAIGAIVFLISVVTMGNNWRAGVNKDEKTELVTRGIYGISRNPAFLGFDLVYIGLMLMFFSWWLCLFTLFAVVMLHLQVVLVEEPFLPTAYGNDYMKYKNKVCRYLGRKFWNK